VSFVEQHLKAVILFFKILDIVLFGITLTRNRLDIMFSYIYIYIYIYIYMCRATLLVICDSQLGIHISRRCLFFFQRN
jgi:hypothetical protein